MPVLTALRMVVHAPLTQPVTVFQAAFVNFTIDCQCLMISPGPVKLRNRLTRNRSPAATADLIHAHAAPSAPVTARQAVVVHDTTRFQLAMIRATMPITAAMTHPTGPSAMNQAAAIRAAWISD